MGSELDAIRSDLASHAGLFNLSDGLGDDLLDVAVNGVKDHFDAEVDPSSNPWPDLQPDYERAKSKHYPGKPIGVRTGLMRSEIDGERAVVVDSAEWTYGVGEVARQEADWFQEGDPYQNRRPRPFADLTPEATAKSDRTLDNHFEKGTQ